MIAAILTFLRALLARPPGATVAEGPLPMPPPPWPALTAHDRDVLIRTLYGEAANESEVGQIAVVHVIRNRLLRGPARRFGGTPAEVCQKPWQFSCWNANDPQRPRLLALAQDSATYTRLGAVVDKAWALPDSVGGADHYYASYIARPAWAVSPAYETVRHGVHQFYAGVA
jgi:N-acetylmuramoyl-L-alanine amidase